MGSAFKSKVSTASVLLAGMVSMGIWPAGASAHGPVDPPASKYLARVSRRPAGVDAKVVDGDQRMWLRVNPRLNVVVLDYRGAPYLRFSRAGVQVNESSSMYYLNQVPAQLPPTDLGPHAPPDWHSAGEGDSYSWHDGRLHALATTVLAPGTSYVGRWTIPLRVDGAVSAITGGLFHSPDPPIVWFWPIFVAIACVPAALRLRRSELDDRLARALATVALVAFAVAGIGQQLHGRPDVSVGQLILLALVLAFAVWGLTRIARGRHGWFVFFLIAAAAIWEGATLIAVLLDGFVLLALPAFLARVAVVACLATGIGLLPLVFAMAERSRPPAEGSAPGRDAGAGGAAGLTLSGIAPPPALTTAGAVAACVLAACTLGACGSASHREPGHEGRAHVPGGVAVAQSAIPAALAAEARPIGHGPRFQPPVSGPVTGACRRALGPRYGVHIEVFAADRVVLLPAGIGASAPFRRAEGRISSARCFGQLTTLEPTGVVLVAPGSRVTVADLFRSWGQPLSDRRLASFTPPADSRVTGFVGGRRWPGQPGVIPLRRHQEIVLEVGPHVPPHFAYRFPPGY